MKTFSKTRKTMRVALAGSFLASTFLAGAAMAAGDAVPVPDPVPVAPPVRVAQLGRALCRPGFRHRRDHPGRLAHLVADL